MKQVPPQTQSTPRRRNRRSVKNQMQPSLQVPELTDGNVEKIDYQVSIAYTQPRRHRPALLPEERLLCELRHKITTSKTIAPFGGTEVVAYDKGAQEKPYFSGGGFFIQKHNDNEFIA